MCVCACVRACAHTYRKHTNIYTCINIHITVILNQVTYKRGVLTAGKVMVPASHRPDCTPALHGSDNPPPPKANVWLIKRKLSGVW